MKARLIGGMAAAALLSTGLAYPSAAAPAPVGSPHTLGFTVSELVTAGDAVYAAGIGEDATAYVAELGGVQSTINTGVLSLDVAAEPDGSTLRAYTVDEESGAFWNVDTATMNRTYGGGDESGDHVALLGSDADGTYTVSEYDTGVLHLAIPGIGDVGLTDAPTSPTATDAVGAGGARRWFIGVSLFTSETPIATLWGYDEAGEATLPTVTLGPDGDPDESVLDVAASPTDDVVYALSFQNQEDGPQTYGLSVVEGEDESYFPLTGTAQRLAISPDGNTLYVSQGSGILALDTHALAANPDAADDVRSAWIPSDSSINDLAINASGELFAAAGTQVYEFGTPGTATGFQYDTSADYPTYAGISWTAPATTGGVASDVLTYYTTLTDQAGGPARSARSFTTDVSFDDLVAGHTYDVSVVVDNGLYRSPAATSSFTAPAAEPHPSSVTIAGTARVGSTLSVTSAGSWAAGTTLTYRWTAGSTTVSTSAKLVVPAGLVGKQVVVAVTGTHGDSVTTVTSSPTARVARGTLSGPRPKITGAVKVGKTLAAKAGTWTAGTKLTYAWSANGKRIQGADNRTLKLGHALAGKRIKVVVTGSKAGYASAAKTSASTGKVKR